MYSLFAFLLPLSCLLTITIADDSCDSSNYHLFTLAIADESSDSSARIKQSAEQYGVILRIIDRNSAGKGQESLSKQATAIIEPYRERNDLVVLVLNGVDAIINSNKDGITCRFLKACHHCRILFPAQTKISPDSPAFIGYAPDVYDWLTYSDSTETIVDPASQDLEKIAVDSKHELLQFVDGNDRDIILGFQDNGDAFVHNVLKDTYPAIIYGTAKGKQLLDYLGNYIGKQWSADFGCRLCRERSFSLEGKDEEEWPLLTLALFISKPVPFIREFLHTVGQLNYVKTRIDLYIYNNQKYNYGDVEKFVQETRKVYRKVEYDNDDAELDEREARRTAIKLALQASSAYIFMLDGDVHLVNPDTPRLLIENALSADLGILASLVIMGDKLFSNFWGALGENGFYARSEDYVEILERKRVGIWNVPYVAGALLISRKKMNALADGYTHNLNSDPDMSFCEFARSEGHFMFVDNQEYYGFLVNSETFNSDKIHPEMYQIFENRYLWEQRYLHADYFAALNGEKEIYQPCPDVYHYPLMSTNFTEELIEEMEHYGKWSGGQNKDDRLVGGYENVPTVDIHMNQIDFEREWLYFLDEYVAPMQEKLFIGYYQRPVQAAMMFVVRYKQGEQPSLRPHHDASTYTIDIPLNQKGRDYDGGGIRYVRYNCTVAADQIGYAAMFPGRLTHFHEGLPVTNGIRYIAVSFLNP